MKNCPLCHKDFEGRSNQKFCSSKCKNAFHNSENKVKEEHVKHINRALHKNWTTLQKVFEIYRSSPIKKEVLIIWYTTWPLNPILITKFK